MKKVKYEHLEQWVNDHDARITQAGSYPAQVVFILEEDLKAFCKAMGLPHMGPLSGGRCYKLNGDDFFAVVLCFKLDSGQLISAIAHGCYRATNFIYKRYNVRHSLGNDEPAAYLISHMAYYATKFIEEQGYGLKRLDGWDCCRDGQNSGDLRPELSGQEQGRVDGSAEPATGAGGQVPWQEPNEEYAPIIPYGDAGRCTGHPEPRPDTDLTCEICGERYAEGHAHACTTPEREPKPNMRQCPYCGVRYFATHKHSCNKHDIKAWEDRHEH